MISVLYVDDEPTLLEIGKIFLENRGDFIVKTLSSAKEALVHLDTVQYDAIISDYQMPGMDGIEFLKSLRGRGNHTPFIIFTGKGREEIVIQALNEGADFYLQKGGDPEPQYAELEHKVKLVVKKQRTEASLKLSEEILTAVVSGTPVPKFVINSEHRIIYWNRALEVSTGISASQVMGTCEHWRAFYPKERPTMADLILDDGLDRIHELYSGTVSDSTVVPGMYDVLEFFPHLGEKGKWLKFMAAPIQNEDGVILGAVETLIDVTDIKNKEDELRQSCEKIAAAEEELRQQLEEIVGGEASLRTSEERYRRFIETSYEGVWSMDRNFNTLFVNQRLADMFGYSKEEMLGRPISSLMHPDDLADNSRRLAERQTGMSDRYERRFVRKDGTTLFALVSATPLFERGSFAGSFAMISDITDHKKMERELLEHQVQLANAMDLAHLVNWEYDAASGLFTFNDRFYALYGTTAEKEGGYGMPAELYAREFVHPDDAHFVRDEIRKALATHDPHFTAELEHRIIRWDGETRTILIRYGVVMNTEGHVIRIHGANQDITQRKNAEDLLRKKSREYQDLLENISDVYYRSDDRGNLVIASQSWAFLLGYTNLSECLGKNIASTFYADPSERSRFLEDVYRNGSVTDYEVVLKKKDGNPVTVATSSYLFFDESGHILGVEGTFRDITERKRMLENLRETERRLSDIINFLPDPTFAIDRNGVVIAWNHAIAEMTEVPMETMIGKGQYEYAFPFYSERRPILIDLISHADADIIRNYSSVQRKGSVLTAETRMAHLGGKELVLWGKAGPLYNSNGEIAGAIESIRDITDRRILEDSLRQVNKKLNLMSSITRHDILNNITACRGYLAIAKRKISDPEVQELVTRLELVIGAIHAQIGFTRVYQDLGATAPVWQDIGELVKKCTNISNIPIISEISGLEVFADPLIGTVFTNLFDNSVRHGERVTEIHVRAEPRHEGFVVSWEDNGVGILPDEKELIFDRGFGKNTGLGLFLVREILEITSISIRETGEPGRGARFEIFIPQGISRQITAPRS